MLIIKTDEANMFDEETEQFVYTPSTTLRLEHSLLALSKWESHWEKSFLDSIDSKKTPLTTEQMLYYIKCMCIDDVEDSVILSLSEKNIKDINDYIGSKQTATSITENAPPANKKKQIWTSELFYYNIFANQIPIEVEQWNINRLFTLFSIFRIEAEKADPKKKKRTQSEINKFYEDREALNARRKAMLKTKG